MHRSLARDLRVVAMSPGVEDDDSPDTDVPTVTMQRASETVYRPSSGPDEHHEDHHHHILIEAQEDRWAWRRKIRQDKRKLAVYRFAVGLLGLLLIALGLVSGPLPGPGGIPLVLLGLAVWSSEFEWAHQVMLWFKQQLHRYRTSSTPKKVLFWVAFFSCCGLLGYVYLLALGVPGWLPGSVDVVLQRVPGL
jgi:uncharacterized protein (TIGR02611 family)